MNYHNSLVEKSVIIPIREAYKNEKPKIVTMIHSRILVECGDNYKDSIPDTYTCKVSYQTGTQCYEYIDNKETRLLLILSGIDIPDSILRY